MEDPIKKQQNLSTVSKPLVQRTIMRIINPKSQSTEEKKFVVALKSGEKFLGSTHPQYPNQQAKKIFIIRNTKQQISTKPQLFTLPEISNSRKFVVKEIPKGEQLKTSNSLSLNKTMIANPVSKDGTFTMGGNKYKLLHPVHKIPSTSNTSKIMIRQRIPLDNEQTSETNKIGKQILRKEMILLNESHEIMAQEPQILHDPIDISGTSSPILQGFTKQDQIFARQQIVDRICVEKQITEIEIDSNLKKSNNSEEEPLLVDDVILPSIDEEIPSTSSQFDQPSTSTQSKNFETSTKLAKIDKNVTKKLSKSEKSLDFLDDLIFANLDNLETIKSELAQNKEFKENDNYSCTHCNRDFKSYTELVKHWLELKNTCEICDIVFPFPFLLEMHVQDIHNIKGYKCKNCQYFNSNLWNLKLHRMRGHCQEYEYPCDNCDRVFNNSDKLKLHNNEEHKIEKIKTKLCDFCGRSFLNNYTLQCHIKNFHLQNKKFTCKQCGKICETRATYGRHLQSHRMKKIICEHCGKKFDIQSDLKSHMRQHTGEKPYKCSICSKTFAKSNTLRQHLLIHTGKRPYVCDICGKTFTQKPGLTAHRKSHPGALPQMPCLYINDILQELPDDAFQNMGAKSESQFDNNDEEKEDDVDEEIVNNEKKNEDNINNFNEDNETNTIEANVMEIVANEANILDIAANEANILKMDANVANILKIVENENNVLEDILVNSEIEINVNLTEKKRKELDTTNIQQVNKKSNKRKLQNTKTKDDNEEKISEIEEKITESEEEKASTRPKRKCTTKRW